MGNFWIGLSALPTRVTRLIRYIEKSICNPEEGIFIRPHRVVIGIIIFALTSSLLPLKVAGHTSVRIYNFDLSEYMVEIVTCGDDGLAIGGYSFFTSQRANDFVLIRTDRYGDLYWIRTYGSSSNEYLHALVKCQDNGFLLVGEKYDYLGTYIPWILRVDSSGDQMWNKTYLSEDQDFSSLDDIAELSNGDIVTAGSLRIEGLNFTQAWVCKLDFNGTVIWSKTYGNESHSVACRTITSCKNGDLMMFGNSYRKEDGGGNFWGMRLNGSGEKVWERIYDKVGHESLSSGLETDDGGFVMTGRWEPEGWPAYQNRMYSIGTDSNGVLLWSKYYTDSEEEYSIRESTSGIDIIQCEDKGFAILGYTDSLAANTQNLWLVRIDESGEKLWSNTLFRDYLDFPKSLVNQSSRFIALATTIEGPVASDYDTMLVFFDDIDPLNQSTGTTTPEPFGLSNLIIISGTGVIVAIPILYWINRRRKISP